MVIIKTAIFSFIIFFKSSRSTFPLLSDLTVITSNPAIAADAGLVPWAESGIIAIFF